MALRTITLTGTTIGNDISTVDIYGTSVTPGNLITSSITSQSLADGFTFQADETIYTFQLVTDSVCAVTQSIALSQAPVGSWAPIGTDGPTNSSFTTIGGEIISESLGDLAYSFNESTWMVVPTYRDKTENTTYVFTSVDNGLTWLKETNTDGTQWRGIVDAIGCRFFGSNLYNGTNTSTTQCTGDAGNTMSNIDAYRHNTNTCLFHPNENLSTTKTIGITDKNASDWHIYATSRNSTYVHTYDCLVNSAWGGPISCAATSNTQVLGLSITADYSVAGAYCSTSTANIVQNYINFRYSLPCNMGCHLNAQQISIPANEQGFAHQSMGSIENIASSICSQFNTMVFIGQEGGHISRGSRCVQLAVNNDNQWDWDTIDSGTTNTNFTISAVVGSSGSAVNPKGEVLAAAINTSTNSAGYFVTSSDLGTSWSQYTAPDLGEGVINHLIHDGTKYIGVGYSGSEGRFYQSRGDCISNSWIEATTCAPVYKTMYANGVYLSVGDYGSIYRGV